MGNTLSSLDPAIEWLLKSEDPSIQFFTYVDILGISQNSLKIKAISKKIPRGPKVRILLSGQKPDGGFGAHPYQKWTGAHWRLVSLVELGIPEDNPQARAAANQVLTWLWGQSHRSKIRKIRGLTRRCASQEGNALAVCCRLGMASDPRVSQLAYSLIEWEWPDGGWNCDKKPSAKHSSFYESLAPLWGLIEYHHATGDEVCLEAAENATELFLRHNLFRYETRAGIIDSEWVKLHYPLYWHYDILQALRILAPLGKLKDPRVEEALDIVEDKRKADGLWWPEGYYWWPPGTKKSNVEVVNWGRGAPNEMITLNALRVLKLAGRI